MCGTVSLCIHKNCNNADNYACLGKLWRWSQGCMVIWDNEHGGELPPCSYEGDGSFMVWGKGTARSGNSREVPSMSCVMAAASEGTPYWSV